MIQTEIRKRQYGKKSKKASYLHRIPMLLSSINFNKIADFTRFNKYRNVLSLRIVEDKLLNSETEQSMMGT